MQTENARIKALLDLTWKWCIVNESSLCATSGNGRTFKDSVIDDAYLATAHPDLPAAIRALILNIERPGKHAGTAPGGCVFQTFYMLTYGTVSITDSYRREIVYTELDDLAIPSDPLGPVRMLGTSADIERFSYAGKTISCVVNHGWTDTLVERSELDNRYPGWLERWNIGKTLGLADRDLIKHTFSELPRHSASVTDITFG